MNEAKIRSITQIEDVGVFRTQLPGENQDV